jgi:hypothetical protein
MSKYGRLFGVTGFLGLVGSTVGIGYTLSNQMKDTCQNTVSSLTNFLTSENPITLKNINTNLEGYPVLLTETSLFPREQLSNYWINFLENMPANAGWYCERGTWTLVCFGALLVLLGAGTITALYNSMKKNTVELDPINREEIRNYNTVEMR